MADIVIEDSGKIRKLEDITLAEEVIKLKNSKNHWAVIDLLLKSWLKKDPEDVQAFKIDLEDTKETLDDPKFAATKGGKDFDRRFTLIFPSDLQLMLRSVYSSEELSFDQKFFREFARRYPFFRVADKI